MFHHLRPPRLLFTVAAFLSCPTLDAAPFIEHIEPPVVQCGKTTRVTLVGTELTPAVGLWTSLPAGKVRARPVQGGPAGRAVFEMEVAADTPVGTCGVRVATPDGLSNVHLFLVDDLPVSAAPMAKDRPPQVRLPACLWGTFREGAADRFRIEAAAGQRVAFEVVASRFGTDADPLLTIHDGKGVLVVEKNIDPGLYNDCRFEQLFAAAGTYTIALRDARYHGSEHWQYALRMGRFPAARVAVPATVRAGRKASVLLPEVGGDLFAVDVPLSQSAGPIFATFRRAGDDGSSWLPLTVSEQEVTIAREPCGSFAEATPAVAPGILCGVLRKPGDWHFFRFELTRGQTVRVRGEARALNSAADLELLLTDAAGKELQRVQNAGQDEVVLEFKAGNTAAYGLAVRDLARDGGPAFAFRLDVQTGQPRVEVTADVEGLTIPRGSYQPVPLSVSRSGFDGPIELSLVGAPAGVTLTPAQVPAGASSVICKLSAAAEAPTGLHTLQILVRPAGGMTATLVRTRPLIDRLRVNRDLVPFGLRENQKRLPPALTDRLAVFVTEPAPFTMELPEPRLALARLLHVDFPVRTTRSPGFDGPIGFTARGGQLADKSDIRSSLYAELPEATADRLAVVGAIHSRILSRPGTARIDVSGTASYRGRRITLTRSFELDVRTAFELSAEPVALKLQPGGSARVRLKVERVKPFAGAVKVRFDPIRGLTLPESLVIPAGQTGVDLEVKTDADIRPGRYQVRPRAHAEVGGFEEETRGQLFEVEVLKPEAAKK
jgi:hypothetical protein